VNRYSILTSNYILTYHDTCSPRHRGFSESPLTRSYCAPNLPFPTMSNSYFYLSLLKTLPRITPTSYCLLLGASRRSLTQEVLYASSILANSQHPSEKLNFHGLNPFLNPATIYQTRLLVAKKSGATTSTSNATFPATRLPSSPPILTPWVFLNPTWSANSGDKRTDKHFPTTAASTYPSRRKRICWEPGCTVNPCDGPRIRKLMGVWLTWLICPTDVRICTNSKAIVWYHGFGFGFKTSLARTMRPAFVAAETAIKTGDPGFLFCHRKKRRQWAARMERYAATEGVRRERKM
jgi:hypothetical protein